MSEVALSIGGRVYRVACAAGEEDHVSRLGAVINEKLAAMGNLSGHDAQNLLFAGLMLADELHEGHGTAPRSADDTAAAHALAETATGERDELKAALANRDAGFARLQTEHRDTAQALQAANARLAESEANQSALHERIDSLTRERDAAATRSPPTASEIDASDRDLAPALEGLAQMLEQCADKLERPPRSS